MFEFVVVELFRHSDVLVQLNPSFLQFSDVLAVPFVLVEFALVVVHERRRHQQNENCTLEPPRILQENSFSRHRVLDNSHCRAGDETGVEKELGVVPLEDSDRGLLRFKSGDVHVLLGLSFDEAHFLFNFHFLFVNYNDRTIITSHF